MFLERNNIIFRQKLDFPATVQFGCGAFFVTSIVPNFCRNDELSWLFANRFWDIYLICRKSQILLKISVIPILLTFMYLVALNLLVNNQLN